MTAAAAVRSLRARRMRPCAASISAASSSAPDARARSRASCIIGRASASSVATPTPPSTFLSIASRRVPQASRQASIVYRCRPMASSGRLPDQRSFATSRIGASMGGPPDSGRSSTAAPSMSWPSAKMSAVTSRRSPTTRLTGCRPPSSSGARRSMMMVRRVPTATAGGSGRTAAPACPLRACAATRRRLVRVVVMVFSTLPHQDRRGQATPVQHTGVGGRLRRTMRPRARPGRAFVAGLALALAACQAATPTVSLPTGGSTNPPLPTGPDHLALQAVATGLDHPIGIANAGDGSGRLFVNEQAGTVRVVDAGGAVRKDPFVDLRDRILAGGERGLLGLAFHPGFPQDGRVYVDYTRRPDGATVVSELAATADRADPASERILLVIPQPFANHNGGQLAFGPDGYLYIGTGDGGSGGDPIRQRTEHRACSWARSCASTSTARHRRQSPTPSRPPTPSPPTGPTRVAAPPRSGPTGCATPGDSASIRRTATCTSATSDRAPGRRWTASRATRPAARTTAGT